jgi:DNA-damage-inducible protein J
METIAPPSVRHAAETVFAHYGITAEQAVALFYRQVSQEQDLPFSLNQPNAQTLAAMRELREGGGEGFSDLLDDLGDA